jgi:hypothetical protein
MKDKDADTYFAQAQKAAEEHAGGRFGNVAPPTLTGTADASPLVAPNWSTNLDPAEPPLGDLGFLNAEQIAQHRRIARKRRV